MSSELGCEQVGCRDLRLLGNGLWTADGHGQGTVRRRSNSVRKWIRSRKPCPDWANAWTGVWPASLVNQQFELACVWALCPLGGSVHSVGLLRLKRDPNPEQFESLLAQGAQMSLDQALALVLDEEGGLQRLATS